VQDSKNKFTVGQLVRYNFKNIKGAQEKVGIILSLKESTLYTWVYQVRWTNGEEETYPQMHLVALG